LIFAVLIYSYIDVRDADIYPFREISVLFSLFSALIIEYYSATCLFFKCLRLSIYQFNTTYIDNHSAKINIYWCSRCWYIHILIFAMLIYSYIDFRDADIFIYWFSRCWYIHYKGSLITYIRLSNADIYIYSSAKCRYTTEFLHRILIFAILLYTYIDIRCAYIIVHFQLYLSLHPSIQIN